jgi:ATP-dependent Clp endopeptidase proteolytic subunit ClpP
MKNWKRIRNDDEIQVEEPRFIIEKTIGDSSNNQVGNKIYFYSDVSRDTVLNLNKQIDELTKQLKTVQYTYSLPKAPPIEIHICSDGGDVFSAMAAVDKIKGNDVPVNTYCEGMVASAATLLSTSGNKRFISKSSCMLIHQVSSGLWGNYMEFKDEIKNLELIMNLIKSVYLKSTKFDSKKLDDLLSHDLYLSANECLKYGLVDEIV